MKPWPIAMNALAERSTASRVCECSSSLRALDPVCAPDFFAIAGDGRAYASGGGSELRMESGGASGRNAAWRLDRQYPGCASVPATEIDFERTIPDRPVPTTAKCVLSRDVPSLPAVVMRPRARLQRLDWSDPNVHRADAMAQKECEWKHGERAVLRNRFLSTENDCMTGMSNQYFKRLSWDATICIRSGPGPPPPP